MIKFWLKESIKGIRRTKSSFLISLVSTTVAVILILLSVLLTGISEEFQLKVKESLSISIFIEEGTDESYIKKLSLYLDENDAIKRKNFISKEKAAEIFIKDTGEDFRSILDYNPLPASFTISLNDNYINNSSIASIVNDLKAKEGVEEVVFNQDAAHNILEFLNRIKNYVFIGTIILVLIAVYIVYSTTKLIIISKQEEIETMKLVGAKLSTIKAPIILNALLIGIFSGGITFLIFYALQKFVPGSINSNIIPSGIVFYLWLILITAGPLLGVMVSSFALRKISLKI
jgi:cell division transport system permease protein